MPTVILTQGGQTVEVNSNRATLQLIQGNQADLEFEAGGVFTTVQLTTHNPVQVVENDSGFIVTLLPGFGAVQVQVTWN